MSPKLLLRQRPSLFGKGPPEFEVGLARVGAAVGGLAFLHQSRLVLMSRVPSHLHHGLTELLSLGGGQFIELLLHLGGRFNAACILLVLNQFLEVAHWIMFERLQHVSMLPGPLTGGLAPIVKVG